MAPDGVIDLYSDGEDGDGGETDGGAGGRGGRGDLGDEIECFAGVGNEGGVGTPLDGVDGGSEGGDHSGDDTPIDDGRSEGGEGDEIGGGEGGGEGGAESPLFFDEASSEGDEDEDGVEFVDAEPQWRTTTTENDDGDDVAFVAERGGEVRGGEATDGSPALPPVAPLFSPPSPAPTSSGPGDSRTSRWFLARLSPTRTPL